jgi:Tol biopolymer transport system component
MSNDFTRRGPEGPGSWGSTAAAGPTVPRYRILGLVGIGGMGVVYRAEDTRLGRTVALKFLPPMLTPNPRAKARFLDEARAASALDHTNICTIYEVGETAEGQLYFAMAFYEGETLKRRLGRGSLPVAEALRIALEVARGLAAAHHHGIVHRDIKPANLMITEDGIVKILDFGIALLPDQALSGPLLGTPGYMSPEQERGGTVDARSDVWSLGAVLHEMLTGRLPARRGHQEEPAGEVPPALLPWREQLPGIDGVLSRMLAEEPADRDPDAGALLAGLAALERAAAGGERARATGPGRRRVPAWAIALVAALVLAAGSGLLWSLRRHGGAGPDPGQATFTRLTDLPGKEWFPSLDPQGEFFVYARKDGDQSRLFWQPVEGGKAVELLPDSPGGDSQPSLSPDGEQVAFRSERDGGGIFLLRLKGRSVRRIADAGFNPAWSPDGREIVYATDGVDSPLIRRYSPSQIFRVDVATGERRRVHPGDAVQPSWSPRGFRIAYWGLSPAGQRLIWTLPASGGKAVRVTAGRSVDWNPVWSPDGRYLYFASDRSGTTNLWRVPIDERSGSTGDPEPVTTSTQASMLLSLSRDGKRIAYTTDETRTTLEKAAFDPGSGTLSGPVAAITRTAQIIMTCDVSRDGGWLAYQTSVPHQNLFLIHPDGSGLRQLTADGFNNRQPRWSPDGKRLAFYSNRGGKYEIWLVRADGSQLERAAVLPDRPRAVHPVWSPDGRQLACDLDENEALIDLTRPLADRRPLLLPPAGPGLGFSASSWSADGRWLAGALHVQTPDRRQVPGVVLYSPAERRYVRLSARGEGATWLSDSRRLLYSDGGRIFLFDTLSRTSRQVLTPPPGSDYNDVCLGPDDRVLYLARNTEEGDIWLLTMK